MNKKLYLENGYVNISLILDMGYPFTAITGGRGTGKTYGALDTMISRDARFMFMRRTEAQRRLIAKDDFSPFKAWNISHLENEIRSKSISQYNSGFYHAERNEEGTLVCVGAPIGYTCALSTVSNMRGFDASDCEYLIYDEFIPERHERPIKNEAAAFFNAYETINRNRELNGNKPLQALLLSNANTIANPLYMELNIVSRVERMKQKGRNIYTDDKRGLCVIMLDDSPVSAKKSDTALYRLTRGSDFERMSIGNDFAETEKGRINSRPIAEYNPICRVGEICIYRHKSRQEYFVSYHVSGNPPTYSTGEIDLRRFRASNMWLFDEYIDHNNIVFESYMVELLFRKYLLQK